MPATDDPLEDFAELGRAYRRWALEQPALYDVMFGRSGLREIISGTALDVTMSPLLDAVRRCIAAGVLRDVDPRAAAISIWSSVHGLVSLEIAGYLEDDQEVLEQHLLATATYWLPPGGPRWHGPSAPSRPLSRASRRTRPGQVGRDSTPMREPEAPRRRALLPGPQPVTRDASRQPRMLDQQHARVDGDRHGPDRDAVRREPRLRRRPGRTPRVRRRPRPPGRRAPSRAWAVLR